ncbi:MAG TPA: DUF1697 domain-containing protein [Bryobacteraceae bacterium]|nr:DUF1697 domain-containing protein [Bryobacteraceae bacterium]
MKHVALLRGINVGGKNKLAMKDLASLFTAAGCRDVTTYIQSGNVIFNAHAPLLKKLAPAISIAILDRFGLRVPIVIRSHEQLAAAAGTNPYLAEGIDPKCLHLMFLATHPAPAAVATLDPDRSPPSRFHVHGQDIYLHFPQGVAQNKITNAWIDAKLSTVSTIRNWSTVLKLIELTRG